MSKLSLTWKIWLAIGIGVLGWTGYEHITDTVRSYLFNNPTISLIYGYVFGSSVIGLSLWAKRKTNQEQHNTF